MNSIHDPILVTGGAGFIGSWLVERLLAAGFKVDVLDNLSTGSADYIKKWTASENFQFHNIDLLDTTKLNQLGNYRTVYHLAANPEVKTSSINPQVSFKQNIVTTFNLLEAIRTSPPEVFVFASSSTVYGEPSILPTPENYGPLEPISSYGATKLACEALVSAYANTFNFKAVICRLANIVGENSTHGVIYDFIRKLSADSSQLEVLGDGKQNKSYLYALDCINAIQAAVTNASDAVNVFNIGSDDQVDVLTIANLVIQNMGLDRAIIKLTGGVEGGRGWKGDVKNMILDISKLKSTGWTSLYNSEGALRRTAQQIIKQEYMISSSQSQYSHA